jgi:head-tail adaptor
MSFGKMSGFIEIVSTERGKDAEGFAVTGDRTIASVRAYREDRHGTEAWANRAAFSTASAMFRFRKIPDIEVTTAMTIICDNARYNILSVEDVKGRGMYIEVLAERVKPSGAM